MKTLLCLLCVFTLSCESYNQQQIEIKQKKAVNELKHDKMEKCKRELYSKYFKEGVANSTTIEMTWESTAAIERSAEHKANIECKLKLRLENNNSKTNCNRDTSTN